MMIARIRNLAVVCLCACSAPTRPPAPAPVAIDAAPVLADAAPVLVDAAPVALATDAAPVPVDAAVAIAVDAGTQVCSTHYNMLPDAKVLVGMTEAQVRCSISATPAIAGATWTYRLPPFCSDVEDVVTIVFANGRVARASSVRRHTGKFCQ